MCLFANLFASFVHDPTLGQCALAQYPYIQIADLRTELGSRACTDPTDWGVGSIVKDSEGIERMSTHSRSRIRNIVYTR